MKAVQRDLFADDDFDLSADRPFFDLGPTESSATISPRVLQRERKAKTIAAMKREALADVMPALPEPGYSYHVVSNAPSTTGPGSPRWPGTWATLRSFTAPPGP